MLVGSALTTPLHTLFQSLGHTPDGGSNHLQRNLVPNLPQLCLQLLNVLDALHFTNFAVEVRPHSFNWIEVRALRGMILDAIRSNFIEELDGFFGGVGLGAVLHKIQSLRRALGQSLKKYGGSRCSIIFLYSSELRFPVKK